MRGMLPPKEARMRMCIMKVGERRPTTQGLKPAECLPTIARVLKRILDDADWRGRIPGMRSTCSKLCASDRGRRHGGWCNLMKRGLFAAVCVGSMIWSVEVRAQCSPTDHIYIDLRLVPRRPAYTQEQLHAKMSNPWTSEAEKTRVQEQAVHQADPIQMPMNNGYVLISPMDPVSNSLCRPPTGHQSGCPPHCDELWRIKPPPL